ncbi:MAG: HAMP domain-containing histidine kinase [Oscillospiraceae bacterium]|jgi:signal transduction histidine kinase|nr:HAMP domain-containing histidine kinase [Oscillospiraceae bacterium]
MNRYIFRKTLRFVIAAGSAAVAAAVYIILMLAVLLSRIEDRSAERIAAHQLQNELEALLADGRGLPFLPDSGFGYAVFDLEGGNLGSTIPMYRGGIDVRLLSAMKEYTAPLIVDGAQAGTLVADIPRRAPWGTVFLTGAPVLILCAGLTVLQARHIWFVKTDIIRPLEELHGVVERMVKGDLSVSVSYDYDGEMGALCHDFEAMRDELRDAAQRERSHQEKERLLFASLSHDLKTPLSSISGYAESIRYGVVKERADIERYTGIILKKTRDLTRSIEDILTHVQTQMHEMSIKKEELYSKPLFEKLLADAAHDAAVKGLTLELRGEIPNRLILADPARIAQVWQNITGNAIKYTEAGGRITVSVEAAREELRVSVEDTGRGIRPEDMPFVFEPFFRGEKSRDPNVSGSGLGLSIARYIVERHGGRITCESVPDEGTKVAFSVVI